MRNDSPQKLVVDSLTTSTTIQSAAAATAVSSTTDLLSIFLTMDCLLRYHYLLPIELRHIIKYYLYEPLTNESIRQAMKMWLTNNSSLPIHTTTSSNYRLSLLRYGHISYWDTSNVTDMSYLILSDPVTELLKSSYACCFNESIERWDVSHVTDMSG